MWESLGTLSNMPHQYWSADELVDFYLELNKHWWEEKTNELYLKREAAGAMLRFFLKFNEELSDIPYGLIYVQNNFERDFLPHFRKVI